MLDGFEDGVVDPSSVSGDGAVTLATTTFLSYDGLRSAHVTHDGATEGVSYGRRQETVNWGSGAEVWYGGAFYLPSNFYTEFRSFCQIMRWDNFDSATNTSEDQGGLVIDSDGSAMIVAKDFDNSTGQAYAYELPGTTFVIPTGRWIWIEVFQRFEPSDPYTAVYLDDVLVGTSSSPNYGYDKPVEITRMRWGFVDLSGQGGSPARPIELYFDRLSITASQRYSLPR